MRANRSKNTKPEMMVRRMLHAQGYRYRLHRGDLPGKPDIVFASRRKVIEVRGCFWHGHGCFPLGQLPRTRKEYWTPKIASNKARDEKNAVELRSMGWSLFEIWECHLRAEHQATLESVKAFLGAPRIV